LKQQKCVYINDSSSKMKNMGQGPCAACPEPFTEVNGKDHTISVNLTVNCQSPTGEKEATLSSDDFRWLEF
jgi:hypothetical protein